MGSKWLTATALSGGGGGGGGAWSKLASATLASPSAELASGTFTAKELLQVLIYAKSNGGTKASAVVVGSSGSYTTSGYKYNRQNANTFESGISQSSIILQPDTTLDADLFCILWIVNFDGDTKIFNSAQSGLDNNIFGRTAGTSNQSNQITDIKILANAHGGTAPTFGTGTMLEVLGRDFDD